MTVLRKVDPETANRVPNVSKIIGMHNVLIRGYAEVNNLTVWRTATENLAEVVMAGEALLADAGPPRATRPGLVIDTCVHCGGMTQCVGRCRDASS